GFNVGININKDGGQSRSHAAIHIIPRYRGDATGNKGGIRYVIPKSKK
ncbi:MAG TPA: HIT family protein, partial [Microcoleaceae bacterium UBA9251]|nr:HIT family protein [Microcoleaceae cyanobacterium UBA9251]